MEIALLKHGVLVSDTEARDLAAWLVIQSRLIFMIDNTSIYHRTDLMANVHDQYPECPSFRPVCTS